jgi:epoxyqueuosine reductase
MEEFLVARGCNVDRQIKVPARWAAAKSGATTFGKNTFAYVEGIGSFVVIYTLVIDQELEYNQPTMDCHCPPHCRACIDACPTGAIYEPFKLDPERCLGFNAWMRQEKNRIPTVIPKEIRAKMGTRVHGCDLCQEACPKNHQKLQSHLPEDEFLEEIAMNFTLAKMLPMPEDFFPQERSTHYVQLYRGF